MLVVWLKSLLKIVDLGLFINKNPFFK